MTLERDHILLYGPKPVTENGIRTRNKVLKPCGCWSAEVWRTITAPEGITAVDAAGRPVEQSVTQWCQDTVLCSTHSAKAVIMSLQLGERVNGPSFLDKLGDGARRLLADSARVLAEADALDQEMKALGRNIETKRLPK